MTDPVFPLRTILFQLLFLLVAIALEARVLHQRLRISRKTSVEYATSINLLAAVTGWLCFFVAQSLLPQPLRTQIISYIFFDRLPTSQVQSFNLMIPLTGIGIFFFAFIIKLKGLELLQALIQSSQEKQRLDQPDPQGQPALADRLNRAISHTDTNQATAVLLANAYSHSAILLLLFLRFLQFHPLIW